MNTYETDLRTAPGEEILENVSMDSSEILGFDDFDSADEQKKVDTKEETDKKCPQCGGVMTFSPENGQMKCPYCDYEEEIHITEDEVTSAAELDFYQAEHTANKDWGVETKTVLCQACGAQSIYDALQTSGVCPFCGSNQVMEAHEEDTIAPGGVVPFQITEDEAAQYFYTWINKKWFCPKLAKESVKPKSFKGIYLPYWTFDAKTSASYHGQYGTTHVKRNSKGETKTEIRWHSTSGSFRNFFDDELVLASQNHDASILRGLEPFLTSDNKAYKPEYVAGFVAERYSIGLKDAWEKAKNSIHDKLVNMATDHIRSRHSTVHVRSVSVSASYDDITYKYLLLPIWISNFKYKDKVYQFMVNGQTGKVSGKTPISAIKVAFAVVTAILIALAVYYIYIE